ncbi:hypothetical protein NDU88_007111 [Pleurodeles waltl]|uniref:Uncharacterized protein n=1 Tax=Pleurodeles waltl TaxID=8319 RepID=A0AAV7URG4_PLEWA|nr:hypothetical protein NDU88_007111 [Pleurodeles waltl]
MTRFHYVCDVRNLLVSVEPRAYLEGPVPRTPFSVKKIFTHFRLQCIHCAVTTTIWRRGVQRCTGCVGNVVESTAGTYINADGLGASGPFLPGDCLLKKDI